jgi:hypothetical protein
MYPLETSMRVTKQTPDDMFEDMELVNVSLDV